jgi:O-methyltransferase
MLLPKTENMADKPVSEINSPVNSYKKTGVGMIRQLKRLAKRIRLITGLYNWLRFFRDMRIQDLWDLCRMTPKSKLIMRVKPRTMEGMGFSRLSNLYEQSSLFERKSVGGSFIECGVYDGGTAAVIATMARENINRHVWLFDSWDGFPEPDENDIDFEPESAYSEGYSCSEERVKELLFNRMSLDDTRIHVVKGSFSDTLPKSDTGIIALLHLNHPLYRSTKYCLEQLYDKIIEGGCIVIDDYGYWKGCKKAVDDFIENRKLKVEIIRIDYHAAYFFKEPAEKN